MPPEYASPRNAPMLTRKLRIDAPVERLIHLMKILFTKQTISVTQAIYSMNTNGLKLDIENMVVFN